MDDLAKLIERSRALETQFKTFGFDKKRCAAAMSLIREAAQTGETVGRFEDRRLLQGMMDYWASIVRIGLGSSATAIEMNEVQEIFVPPPLAAFIPTDQYDDLTPISLDEFLRLVERRAYATKRQLRNEVVPAQDPLLVNAMDSQFYNCVLSHVRFASDSLFIRSGFIKCQMDDVVARGVVFSNSRFLNCHLEHADFARANFTQALIRNCTFDDRTHFLESNFTFAILNEMTGQSVIFRNAKMGTVELTDSALTDCDFMGADLKDAKLWGSNFQGSKFNGASLKEADLDGAVFADCDLTEADFQGVRNYDHANFEGSSFDRALFTPAVLADLRSRFHTAAQLADDRDKKIMRPNFKTGTQE